MNEIEVVAIPGQDTLEELQRGLEEAADTGFHPILVGDAEEYDRILEGVENGEEPESILRDAASFDVQKWFETGRERNTVVIGVEAGPCGCKGEKWSGLVTHLQSPSGLPKASILIRNFDVPAAWHAFAHLAWGGWNSSPPAKVHCAVHRYWAENYGAEVVSITGTAVQCRVSHPPTDLKSALQLAHEQYTYCPNVVDRATPSISALAANLMFAEFWYFSWD